MKIKSVIQYQDDDVKINIKVFTNGTFKNKSYLDFSKYNQKVYYNNNKEKCDKVSKEYFKTNKGKRARAKSNAKRKEFGYNPLNKFFDNCEGHHLNKNDVIYIPEELHNSIRHSQKDKASMKKINKASFEWLCMQEIL